MSIVLKNRLFLVVAIAALVLLAGILTKDRIVGAAQEKTLRLTVAPTPNQKCDYDETSEFQEILNAETQEDIYFVGCGGVF